MYIKTGQDDKALAINETAAFSKACPYGVVIGSTPGRCIGKDCHAWNNISDTLGYCIRIASDVANARR